MTIETDIRIPTNENVWQAVLIMRGRMEWSQEKLAELTGLTLPSTPQTEIGQQASVDIRREIARAYGGDDLDIFMQPNTATSPERPDAEKS